MKSAALTRRTSCCLLTLGLLACFAAPTLAAPLFAIPGLAPAGPHPVLPIPPVIHFVSPVLPLVPAGTIGPLPYADGLPSFDLHHLEVEINNPAPNPPQTFNLTVSFPVAPLLTAPFTGALTLPTGTSAYLHFHYFDGLTPFDVTLFTPWTFSAAAAPGALIAPLTVHASVLEYPFPFAFVPGPAGPPISCRVPAPPLARPSPERPAWMSPSSPSRHQWLS